MKNKTLKKILNFIILMWKNNFPKSIYKQFIFVILVCLLISGIMYWKIGGIHVEKGNNLFLSNSKKVFYDVNSYCTDIRDKLNNESYMDKLAQLYNVKLAVVTLDGEVVMRSYNFDERKINMNDYIGSTGNDRNRGDSQIFDLNCIDTNGLSVDTYLIIVSNLGLLQNKITVTYGRDPTTAVILGIIIFIFLLFFSIKSKINYLKKITNGILEISKGNLNIVLDRKGSDELSLLADNINQMSNKLKNKIYEEIQIEKSKNEFITSMSHDLKTPLTSVIGYLGLVKDKKYVDNNQAEEFVNIAYVKAEQIKNLIDDLFEFTKLSNGIVELSKERINIIELLEQLIGELSITANTNHVSFLKCFPESNVVVEIDSNMMARVFENIFINSIKYSYKPSVIKVEVKSQNSDVLIITENDGETIPEEDLAHIFDRFYQVDKSRKTSGGSGLGLAIAESIVKLHQGKISAESKENKIRITVILDKSDCEVLN